ncbi:hypothetical protein SAMN04489712_113127 [Thermomonospora echinospora]|uniref:Uncharacterized protein n=1 Tax=Thermomonospora echinospora TaxID=1992 RepID=A0A1H6D5L7_9ACTN|nr:hypothetical protein [Thermomonospora echinospora]SEG80669.1 hypothetical protein SAMN04489712_113127 [Thermomonospora echinospora]
MDSKARSVAAALALAVLPVAAAACGTSTSGGPGQSPGSRSSSHSPLPDQSALASAAARIDAHLRRSFPDHYAGVEIDPSRSVVIVYRRPSSALDADLRARFGDVPTRLHDAPHSARELDRLAARLRDDTGYWRERGVSITSLAVRPDGTAVVVGTDDVAKATRELPRRYGRAPLKIIHATPQLPTSPP